MLDTASSARIESTGPRAPLAARLAAQIAEDAFPAPVADLQNKVKLCLLDLLACAVIARNLPWARDAAALAAQSSGAANIIGTDLKVAPSDAIFANAVAAHGLVQEDMHAGAVSHLGVVILPLLLGLAQRNRVGGKDWLAAAIIGYEVGARIGRAIMTPEISRLFRPTGITGPIGGAAAGSRLLHLDESACTSALALAANTVSGLNEWPSVGGSEMFFHPGFAARNAYAAIMLAQSGSYGSPAALDGEAGLFAALQRRHNEIDIELFAGGEAEILAVYNKALPVCNFAQTPCQAALMLAREEHIDPSEIRSTEIRVSRAAKLYPGCDQPGPFERTLQAKMSIQFAVANALAHGVIDEDSYQRLDDPVAAGLIKSSVLFEDERFTRAFPAAQGAEIEVLLADGRRLRQSLHNVVPASAEAIRARFLSSGADIWGMSRAESIMNFVDRLEESDDVGELGRLMALSSTGI